MEYSVFVSKEGEDDEERSAFHMAKTEMISLSGKLTTAEEEPTTAEPVPAFPRPPSGTPPPVPTDEGPSIELALPNPPPPDPDPPVADPAMFTAKTQAIPLGRHPTSLPELPAVPSDVAAPPQTQLEAQSPSPDAPSSRADEFLPPSHLLAKTLVEPIATGTSNTRSTVGDRIASFYRDATDRFRSLSLRDRVLVASAAITLPVLFLLLRAFTSMGVGETYFVTEATAFLTMPDPSRAALGSLARAEPVELLSDEGTYLLVRDTQSRAGYVLSSAVSSSRPEFALGASFVACRPSPLTEGRRCSVRAQKQLGSCRTACGSQPEVETCRSGCQRAFSDCMWLCDGLDEEVPDVQPGEDGPSAIAPATLPNRTPTRVKYKGKRRKQTKRRRRK